jgi:transcriptional regulator GlxA family with amidase domain
MSRHALLGPANSPAHKIEFLRVARQSRFDLPTIARQLRVSERTVKRFIRLSYDRAAHEWLKEQRLNTSLQCLAASRSVKQAAIEAGFKQQAHYSREFKKQFRITPTTYLLDWEARNPLLG